MSANKEMLIKVETLKNILVGRATGQEGYEDSNDYIELRRELVQNAQICSHLPTFISSCRTLNEFWSFIKPSLKHTLNVGNIYEINLILC
jgi:hypothetical protein